MRSRARFTNSRTALTLLLLAIAGRGVLMSDLFHYLYTATVDGNFTTDYLWQLPIWAQPHALHAGRFLADLFH